MNAIVKPYVLKLLALSLVLEIIISGFYFFVPSIFSFYFLALPFYFFLIMVFFHVLLIQTTQKRAALFVNRYMLLTGIKLFLNLGLLLAFVFTVKDKIVVIVLSFLIQYIVYTTFEVIELLRIFSENKK